MNSTLTDAPFFKNFDKQISDFFDKDFVDHFSVETNCRTPQNVVFTSKNTLFSSRTNIFLTTLSSKFAHSSGFEMNKLELKQNGNYLLNLSYYVGEGLKLTTNHTSKDFYPGVEFHHKNFNVIGETDSSLSNFKLNSVYGYSSFLFGGQAAYNHNKSNIDCDIALRYSTSNYFLNFQLLKCLSRVRLSGSYKFTDTLTFFSRFEGTKENPFNFFTLGASHQPRCKTSVKTKLDSNHRAAVSIQYECAPGVKVNGTASALLNNLSNLKLGVELILG